MSPRPPASPAFGPSGDWAPPPPMTLLNVLVGWLVFDRRVTRVIISGFRADDHQGVGASLHIEAIMMIWSAEWQSSSGYGKAGMSRWAAVRRGPHARPGPADDTVVRRRRRASSRWAEGDTSQHIDGLLKPLEDFLLAAGINRAVPALGILLSVGAAPGPL
jgi:hypothetical protein